MGILQAVFLLFVIVFHATGTHRYVKTVIFHAIRAVAAFLCKVLRSVCAHTSVQCFPLGRVFWEGQPRTAGEATSQQDAEFRQKTNVF